MLNKLLLAILMGFAAGLTASTPLAGRKRPPHPADSLPGGQDLSGFFGSVTAEIEQLRDSHRLLESALDRVDTRLSDHGASQGGAVESLSRDLDHVREQWEQRLAALETRASGTGDDERLAAIENALRALPAEIEQLRQAHRLPELALDQVDARLSEQGTPLSGAVELLSRSLDDVREQWEQRLAAFETRASATGDDERLAAMEKALNSIGRDLVQVRESNRRYGAALEEVTSGRSFGSVTAEIEQLRDSHRLLESALGRVDARLAEHSAPLSGAVELLSRDLDHVREQWEQHLATLETRASGTGDDERFKAIESALSLIGSDLEEVRESNRRYSTTLEKVTADQSRSAVAVREQLEQRLAAIDLRLSYLQARQAELEESVRETSPSPAAPSGNLESRFRDHAEAIQRLQDRVIRIERVNRELMVRVVQLRSGPAAIPMSAEAG